MIIFQSEDTQLDLSYLKTYLVEESNWFVNDTIQDYSLPFYLDFNTDFAKKLGLANLENATNYKTLIHGTLTVFDNFYTAYIRLGEIQGNKQEAALVFGDNLFNVFNTPLKSLPWPTISTTSLVDHAGSVVDLGYPETSHNFPALYRPGIKEGDDYSEFQYFVNKYFGLNFIENVQSTLPDGSVVFRNKNVMAPFPYMLEILRFGYAQEGKTVVGDLITSDFYKKVVYIPDNYFEDFFSNQYDAFSFTTATSTTVIDGQQMGVYQRVYTPTLQGTYQINFDINMFIGVASYFDLKITATDATTEEVTQLYAANSTNGTVNISQELEINVLTDNLYDQIKIELVLPLQEGRIESYNAFEFLYRDGRLNAFPTSFSLAKFMPDMTFGQYVNAIKNWLNLDITPEDNLIRINFIEQEFQQMPIQNKEHLKDPLKKQQLNTDRYFKLKYQNDETLTVDKNGQTYSESTDFNTVINLEMDVYPVKIQGNNGLITGEYTDASGGLFFGIYDGLKSNNNILLSTYNGQDLSLQKNYNDNWKNWLKFRANSKTFKETFKASVYESLNLKNLVLKYNELHVTLSIKKKLTSSKTWTIESETETL